MVTVFLYEDIKRQTTFSRIIEYYSFFFTKFDHFGSLSCLGSGGARLLPLLEFGAFSHLFLALF